jgi:hypothetical protein
VSFILMRELRIRDAFTTDHHFLQENVPVTAEYVSS